MKKLLFLLLSVWFLYWVSSASSCSTLGNCTSSSSSSSEEVLGAKKALWKKASIFESLVPLFKAKDKETQDAVRALLVIFKSSRDPYTRNIGIYFWYLIEIAYWDDEIEDNSSNEQQDNQSSEQANEQWNNQSNNQSNDQTNNQWNNQPSNQWNNQTNNQTNNQPSDQSWISNEPINEELVSDEEIKPIVQSQATNWGTTKYNMFETHSWVVFFSDNKALNEPVNWNQIEIDNYDTIKWITEIWFWCVENTQTVNDCETKILKSEKPDAFKVWPEYLKVFKMK